MKRRSKLAHTQVRLVVYDYRGRNREELAKELKVSAETLKSYWRRVHKKLNCQHYANRREAVRAWVAAVLRAEIEGDEACTAP